MLTLATIQAPDLASRARAVTIRRDLWGIPHVVARRDADVVFGLMFAQAEDDYEDIETSALATIGRSSETKGERGLPNDVRFRAYRIGNLAKARLARADRHFQAIAQAYADGLNFYLQRHPERKPRLARYEPWFFLAGVNLPATVDGIPTAPETLSPDAGSNAWAVGPKKTADHRATLFANPHVDLFGPGARYECVLKSGEGWDFDGFCILGSPIPHAGSNRHLAWSHTNTHADSADAYRLTLVGDDGYRVGDKVLKLERWTETIRVGDGDRNVQLESSIYGPVVRRDGVAYGIRLPIERNLDYWPQKLAMTKARNMREFRKALGMARSPTRTPPTPTTRATSPSGTAAPSPAATRRSTGPGPSTEAIRAPPGRASSPPTNCPTFSIRSPASSRTATPIPGTPLSARTTRGPRTTRRTSSATPRRPAPPTPAASSLRSRSSPSTSSPASPSTPPSTPRESGSPRSSPPSATRPPRRPSPHGTESLTSTPSLPPSTSRRRPGCAPTPVSWASRTTPP